MSLFVNQSDCRGRLLWVVVVAAAITIVLTVAIIQMSYRIGRLTHDPMPDDVGYLLAGYGYFHALETGGVSRMVGEYLESPPHSFLAAALAAGGFFVFGVQVWAPYAANGLVLFAYLLMMLLSAIRCSWWFLAAVGIYAISSPIATMAIHDFKPDPANAIFLNASILVMILGGFVGMRIRPRFGLAGGLLGLAILAKASTFPFTLLIGGFGAVAAVLVAVSADEIRFRFRPVISLAGIFLGGFLLVAGLQLALTLFMEIEYIRQNAFSGLAYVWEHFKFGESQWTYYLTGSGSVPLQWHLWFSLAASLLAIGAALSCRNRVLWLALAAVVAIAALEYFFVSINPMKNAFLGLPAQILLMMFPVAAFGIMWGELKFWIRLSVGGLAAMVMAISALGFHPWVTMSGAYWVADSSSAKRAAANRDVLALLRSQIPDAPEIWTVSVPAFGFVNAQTLQWVALENELPMEFTGTGIAEKPAELLRQARMADFIVVPDTGAEGQYEWIPTNAGLDKLLAEMNRDPRFQIVGKSELRDGSVVTVMMNQDRIRNRSRFSGWSDRSGLESLGTNRYLFLIGKKGHFDFDLPFGEKIAISAKFGSRISETVKVDCFLNGKSIAEWQLTKEAPLVRQVLEAQGQAGANRLEFMVDSGEPQTAKDGKVLSIVFSSLKIDASQPGRKP